MCGKSLTVFLTLPVFLLEHQPMGHNIKQQEGMNLQRSDFVSLQRENKEKFHFKTERWHSLPHNNTNYPPLMTWIFVTPHTTWQAQVWWKKFSPSKHSHAQNICCLPGPLICSACCYIIPPPISTMKLSQQEFDGMLLVLCKTSILGILAYNTILYIDRRENGGITINVALSHRGRNIYKCREEY